MAPTSPTASVRLPPQRLTPKLVISRPETLPSGEKVCEWRISVDCSRVPEGEFIDLIYEFYSPGQYVRRGEGSTSMAFRKTADVAEATRWFLMPAGREYRDFRVIRYETANPEKAEPVNIVTEYLADDYSVLAYKLMSLKAGYTYEVIWHYK
jgi:hypothetical protein